MGRQTFGDGPYVDTIISQPAANTTTTIIPIWVAASFTPIFANDPKAGKIYCVRAGGTISQSAATNTLIITAKYGTGGTTIGAASPAQTMPITSVIPWYLQFDLVFRTIGAAGANSTVIGTGVFLAQGTIATAGTGVVIPFGGTATVDATINANIEVNMTWSGGTISTQPHYAYIFSRN